MKVVFSRKGVDSAAGKCASALIDGRPLSLPIPTHEPSPTTYGDLHPELAALAHDLSGGRLAAHQTCHLDPDLDHAALAQRPPGWRGALGQASAALGHLENQGIGPGDLFLFWGLYRPVCREMGRWRYCGPRQHAVFGWLHIGEVCRIAGSGDDTLRNHPWLRDHPHVRGGWTKPNAVYLASEGFTLDGRRFAGSGQFARAFTLSAPGSALPSIWQVPKWLDPLAGGVGMTYHPAARWLGDGRLKSAARGQEFVADISGRQDAARWIGDLIAAYA
ncbi:MAG: Nmad3 family putative nucleotide modification protein [Erythrobacter sp.]